MADPRERRMISMGIARAMGFRDEGKGHG